MRQDGQRERTNRESGIAEQFVLLADTLVDDYDVVELLDGLAHTCVEFLGATAAGLLLVDERGGVQPVAASTERAHLLELLEMQNVEGPCVDCISTGRPVNVIDLSLLVPRWQRFAPAAMAAGFRSAHALPLRLRSEVIGGLNLFCAPDAILTPQDLRVGQALADVATIGILQQRSLHRQAVLAEQLQAALNSRVGIEQAKGVIAEHAGVDMDVAFDLLRAYSRNHHRKVSEVARDVVRRELDANVITRTMRRT
jgi:GAF domain-containing protein